MKTNYPQKPNAVSAPSAQDATPFLAMMLAEVLELRAMTEAHDLFLRELLDQATGQTEAQSLEYRQTALRACRRKVYKNVEETMLAVFPNHLPMVRTLFREV